MKRASTPEVALNIALAKELKGNADFARWFLRQTRFADQEAECVSVRADNPWSRVRIQVSGPDGAVEEVVRDAETDVLAIFANKDGRRLGIHIENKLRDGTFTLHQPETYRERLSQWRGRPKLGMYVDATSVLVAPQLFYDANVAGAQLFESFISHEAIAAYLPAFADDGAA